VANISGSKILTLPTSVGAETDIKSYFDLFDHLVRSLTGA
jgi:hypothetical protein